jgi:hypothetical protein
MRKRTRPWAEGTVRRGFRWGPIRRGDRDRPPPRVQLVCAVCGRILIGPTPERAAVYRKDHRDATGHAVRIEPVPSAR